MSIQDKTSKLQQLLSIEEYQAVLRTAEIWGVNSNDIVEFLPFALCVSSLNRIEAIAADLPKIGEEISENFAKNAAGSVNNIAKKMTDVYLKKSTEISDLIDQKYLKKMIQINNNVVEVNKQIITYNKKLQYIITALVAVTLLLSTIAFKLIN